MKNSYVVLYKMPTTATLRKVREQGKEIPFYALNENIIGIVISAEGEEIKDGQFMKMTVPKLELLWDLETLVFEYEDYMKLMDDPEHKPTPLTLYEEDTSEDSSGAT